VEKYFNPSRAIKIFFFFFIFNFNGLACGPHYLLIVFSTCAANSTLINGPQWSELLLKYG
jgi:hypothetical protein